MDPERLAIGGASAGGNLAAGAVLKLSTYDITPWQCLLFYPLVHPALPEAAPEATASLERIPPALRVTDDMVVAISENFVGGQTATASPGAFAGLAEDLSGFPPTLIENCEFDEIRRSGEQFAKALAAAGIEVESFLAEGVSHGHLNRVGFPPAHAALDRIAQRLRRPARGHNPITG
ncbi:hypothetical protein StoSoilA2_20880 [Arthrobacter sp. StoSoilA2]|nr:hypothetical protein StoSoilA2_20880 [Arthrobacter sp. StoSoilA2]